MLAHNCNNQNTLIGGYTVVLKRKGAGEIYCSVEVRPVIIAKARRQYLISANHLHNVTAALSTHTSLYANLYSKLQNYMYMGHICVFVDSEKNGKDVGCKKKELRRI